MSLILPIIVYQLLFPRPTHREAYKTESRMLCNDCHWLVVTKCPAKKLLTYEML